ncbi:MAG: 1-deoxy-D-xylulose-5-phosphate reductoisomerase [Clostridia bacterium]|nr:1-deoxy-D-xylulose-5-phosphate reductoisomerase [Clostridia bacterium]
MKKITILGSTGSIGKQALDVVAFNPDAFEVYALVCNTNIDIFEEQLKTFKPTYGVVYDEQAYKNLRARFDSKATTLLMGMESIIEVSCHPTVDFVLGAIVGNIGLIPMYHSIKAGKTIGLANKETLVTAGALLMPLAEETGATIIPVDSEHSAIYQCLKGNDHGAVSKIILTASGGPFRGRNKGELENVLAAQALKHPNWSMGQKITIDSATLMNKGLEVIEAKWLFDVDLDQIDVVVHPQSIIHSMVEYVDRMVLAQLGMPDMRGPISYAMHYPYRKPVNHEPLDLVKLGQLTFEAPDRTAFPCLDLAYEALKMGGVTPTVMNAANEELVYKFLRGDIGFYDIPDTIARYMAQSEQIEAPTLDQILAVDKTIRQKIKMEV